MISRELLLTFPGDIIVEPSGNISILVPDLENIPRCNDWANRTSELGRNMFSDYQKVTFARFDTPGRWVAVSTSRWPEGNIPQEAIQEEVQENTEGEITPEDINQKYINTYLKHKEEWYYLGSIHTNRNRIISSYNKTGSELRIPFKEFDLKRNVYSGVYEDDKGVLLFSRKPERQWKRGICTTNTDVFSPAQYLHNYHSLLLKPAEVKDTKGILTLMSLSSGNYKNVLHSLSVLTRPKRSLSEAIDIIESGEKLSVGLNKSFWLLPHFRNDSYLLFSGGSVIAEVVSKKEINIRNTLLSQEVMDHFNRTGEDVNVY